MSPPYCSILKGVHEPEVRKVEQRKGENGVVKLLIRSELEKHGEDLAELTVEERESTLLVSLLHDDVEKLTGLGGNLLGVPPHRIHRIVATSVRLHKVPQGAWEQLEVDDRGDGGDGDRLGDGGDGGEVGEEGRDVDTAGGDGDGGDGDGNPCTGDKGGCIGIECADHLLLLCRGLRVKVLSEDGFMQEVNASRGILDVVGDETVRINRLTDD